MFQNVCIANFKSIRELKFDARRVNLFIGEPNSGKSNLLEALAFFSSGVLDAKLFKEIFRFRKTPDLFFDREIARNITVQAGSLSFSLKFRPPKGFIGEIASGKKAVRRFDVTNSGLDPYGHKVKDPDFGVGYYRFKSLTRFPDQSLGTIYPPFGSNLVAVISSNQRLRRRVSDLFKSKGFRLQLDPLESEVAIAKDVEDHLFKHPYESVSETLRRVVFFMAIMETNQDATLLLDEPEANTFPFYTKYLAERIALDESNQFFMTTHNPYLLSSVVEKTPLKDLAVFVTRMEKFETKVKQIPDKNLPELLELDSDAFFNLDKLVGE